MPRTITIDEIALVNELYHRAEALKQQRASNIDDVPRGLYEVTLCALFDIVRPAPSASEIALKLIPESPPPPPSPGAMAGEAAATPADPPGGGGGLITDEGLYDALVACHRDLREGHFQPSLHDWPGDVFNYIIRHAARQSDEAALATAMKAAAQ